jgi:hypothetical protein
METRKEFANRVAKMNWNDLIDDPKKLSVEALWRLYAESVFSGVSVSRTQYAETKQAFFIGFGEAFKILSDMSERLEENEACSVLSKINNEVADFMSNVLDRKYKGAPSE